MGMAEEEKLFEQYGPYTGRTILEVGSNHGSSHKHRKVAKDCVYFGLDQAAGDTVQIVHDLTRPLEVAPFDVVLCFSVLEHTPKPWLVAENIGYLLKPGGLLLVSAPFQWRVHNYPDDYFRFTPSGFRSLFDYVNITEEGCWPPKTRLDSHVNGHVQIFLVGTKK